eukprot:99177_1
MTIQYPKIRKICVLVRSDGYLILQFIGPMSSLQINSTQLPNSHLLSNSTHSSSLIIMSAKRKVKKAAPKNPAYKVMVMQAIAANSHFGHGVSRQAIAKHIQSNHACVAGP